MSDTYSAPDAFDPATFILGQQRSAVGDAVTSLDANPDDAARSMELSKANGVPAPVVNSDLDHYEQQTKAAITANLLNSNSFLRDYVNSHPLAAKVSNDDWGALDKASESIKKAFGTSVLHAAFKGFAEGYGSGPPGAYLDYPKTPQEAQAHPAAGALGALVALAGTIPEQTFRVGGGLISAGAGGLAQAWANLTGGDASEYKDRALQALSDPGLLASLGPLGTTAEGIMSQAAELHRAATVIEPWAKAGTPPPVGVHPMVDEALAEQAKGDAKALKEALRDSAATSTLERSPSLFADHFVKQITDAEVGISADAVRKLYGYDPTIDAQITELTARLDKLRSVNNKFDSSRRAQLPSAEEGESTAVFNARIQQHPDFINAIVERNKDLVDERDLSEQIYNLEQKKVAKSPSPGDGLLGDAIPDLATKLAAAEATGGDVKISAGQFLAAHEVTKDLIDDTRVREGGLTVEEAKELPEYEAPEEPKEGEEPAPQPTPVDTLRQAAALEPIEAEGAKPTTKAKQLELPVEGTTRIEDRAEFEKASAIGMTVDQYKRYQGLIEKRLAEDQEAAASRAMAEQRKRQTAEWKANRAELRPEAKDAVESRPEIELDAMLQEGKVKLAKDSLTPEQLASLPPEYVAADGIHPDDLARLFGADDSSDLLNRLNGLTQARVASGMKPKAFHARLIEAETDARMEAKYGSLDRNILEEAKDQVLSETQEQLLHEEVLARASEAGLEYSIGKEELKAAMKEHFDGQKVGEVSSDKSLAEAGKAGRAAEMALLKGDFAEAFRQKQRQYNAVVMANFARKFERFTERGEKLVAKYSSRSLPAVDQEYTNWVHDILLRTGKKIGRSVQDLQTELARGQQKTLAEFVDYKEHHDLRELGVAEFLQDPNFKSSVEGMTTADAVDYYNSIKGLDKNGRDEKKMVREGEAIDLAELKGKLVESLGRFKEKAYDTYGKREQSFAGVRHAIRSAVVAHLQVETVFNRLDRYDPQGPWNQYVFRPLVEGANLEARLEREFATKLGAIADKVNLHESVPNGPFMNPFNQSVPMKMTRKNLRAVILNMGNDSNFTKLAAGYLKQLEPDMEPGGNRVSDMKAQITSWVMQVAKKEDFDWAQKMWDTLKELGDRSATMYRAMTDIAPERLPIRPIQTLFGTYDGGYYPLIRHPTYGEDVKLEKTDLEGQGYVRATTAAGYTKKRTGAVYPLSMDLDGLPNVIKQIIHDTAMRPAIIQAGKIFYDNKIKNEFKKHLGAEYADMFTPWLKDVANTQNYSGGKLAHEFMAFSDFMRQNAVTTLVGLNPSTVMKHTPTAVASSLAEVGPKAFLRGAKALLTVNEETGTSNLQFMMQHSEEMQRRMRNWVETMGGGMKRLEGRTVGTALAQGDYGAAALNVRDLVTQIASTPVALGDFMSSAPTWMGKYMAEMEDHGVHGDAVYAADKSVRQAHGSSAITSKSAVARSKALSWFTGFFTFFNDLQNRTIETLWRAGDAMDLVKEGKKAEALDQARVVGGRMLAYVVVPAMIEELVSPLPAGGQDNWAKTAAKSLAFTLSSSWVGVRDVVNAMLNERDPSVGLLTTVAKSLTDIKRDFSGVHVKPGNIIKHGTALAGMLTGAVPAQIGRTAQFATSNERPKGPWGWLVGARYGTLKHHSQTLDQWWRGK